MNQIGKKLWQLGSEYQRLEEERLECLMQFYVNLKELFEIERAIQNVEEDMDFLIYGKTVEQICNEL